MTERLVAVGSKNPVKVECVRKAFEATMPINDWQVQGLNVLSGISEHPLSFSDARTGARNRAMAALAEADAEFGVGLEGAAIRLGNQWMQGGVIVVRHADGRSGISQTALAMLPPALEQEILSGKPLAEAFAELAGDTAGSFYGFITNEAVTRESAYGDAVAFALAPFVQPDLYAKSNQKGG